MIITVSGYPKSGTTTVCEMFPDLHSSTVTHLNGGDVFRGLADEYDMTLSEFSKHVNNNPEIDKDIDAAIRAGVEYFIHPDNVAIDDLPFSIDQTADVLLVESRLAGWIAGDDATFSVWCKAPLDVRQQRVCDVGDETADEIVTRQKDESKRYHEWYGIDIWSKQPYDFIINTALWSAIDTTKTIIQLAEKYDQSAVETGPKQTHHEQFKQLAEERFLTSTV